MDKDRRNDELLSRYDPTLTISGYDLYCTCGACPEQYEVYLGDEHVGYLRLRHGGFSAEYLDCGDRMVYYTQECQGDGQFDPEERDYFLATAIKHIDEHHRKTKGS